MFQGGIVFFMNKICFLEKNIAPNIEVKVNCAICPRLSEFRAQNNNLYPNYHNAPVPAFGEMTAEILIIGLAPGLHGANQTARPFTGDYAGDVLYSSLLKHGLAEGEYGKIKADGLQLNRVRITNSVRCVPPENKPTTLEIANCNQFLAMEIKAMPNLRNILVLGNVSHNATLKAIGLKRSKYPFRHAANYEINNSVALNKKIQLICSYHTSRYNINTGKLTVDMFDDVIAQLKNH
jgi:uracil-DNA glycosylase